MNLKEVLKSLTTAQRKLLQDAFDSKQNLIINLESNHFIGVNVVEAPSIKVLERINAWVYGEYT